MTTSRVGPSATLARPVAVMLRPVTDDSGTAITARSSSQASDSGTRWAGPEGELLATQQSDSGISSMARVSALRVCGSRGLTGTSGGPVRGRQLPPEPVGVREGPGIAHHGDPVRAGALGI